MCHFFINRRRIDWWKNIWYTSISDWCITELFLDWKFQHFGEINIYQKMAGIVQDGHHSNSVWFRTQCLCSQRQLSCQVAQWQSPHHQILVKSGNFQIFSWPPPRMWNRHNWRPDLQFSSDWQDFDESNRLTHGIWEINSILDVSLKLAILHQAKVHFPANLAVWNPKLGVN